MPLLNGPGVRDEVQAQSREHPSGARQPMNADVPRQKEEWKSKWTLGAGRPDQRPGKASEFRLDWCRSSRSVVLSGRSSKLRTIAGNNNIYLMSRPSPLTSISLYLPVLLSSEQNTNSQSPILPRPIPLNKPRCLPIWTHTAPAVFLTWA